MDYKLSKRVLLVIACMAPVFMPGIGSAAPLASLKTVQVPEPLNLNSYVRDRIAAIQLGKALYWDMQVGSDGVQACATCHFHAGADSRAKNQLNPGQRGGDNLFGNNNLVDENNQPLPVDPAIHGGLGPNATVTRTNFPFHMLTNYDNPGDPRHDAANVRSSINDVMGSQGVVRKNFVDIVRGNPVDLGTPIDDPAFGSGRQVTGRHTPPVINAVFNFANFWDGRANNVFNGNNPFGPADPTPYAYVNTTGGMLTPKVVRLRQSALASQACGPPVDGVEMSWYGRTWHKLGKKMLSLKPLNQQKVHPTDSVLGALADTTTGLKPAYTYQALIRKAFQPKFWNNTTRHLVLVDPANPASPLDQVSVAGPAVATDTTQFSQMEANFALFFGLAVQLYESTLIADDSRVDRFLEGNGALTVEEQRGMATYNGVGSCVVCHNGAETTDASVAMIQGAHPITGIPQPLDSNPLAANDVKFFSRGGTGFYDTFFHNTGVRPGGLPAIVPNSEDIGRGGNTPFLAVDPGNGDNTFPIPLSWATLTVWKLSPNFVQKIDGTTGTTVPVPPSLRAFVPPLPFGLRPTDTAPTEGRVANNGAFKTPHLRNIELTGPYMHNGGLSTVHQVVEFYTRGGDFPVTNLGDFDPLMMPIGLLIGSDVRKNELVAFLLAMTDQRVKNESAPFDHPELFLPIDANAPVSPTGTRDGFITGSAVAPGFQRLPQVGSAGRSAQGLAPVGTFLGLNPLTP